MNTSGEVADQVVRMSLNGVEIAAKITGEGAKQLAIMLYSIIKDQKKTKGKVRLQNMLKNGKELKVFAVKTEDLKKFVTEAKRYGILYSVLRDKNGSDGLVDIMVRAEDASKINRIYERFKLAVVDTASIKSDFEKKKSDKDSVKQPQERDIKQADKEEALLDMLTPNTIRENPEQRQVPQTQNPTMAQTIKSHLSEPISKNKESVEKGIYKTEHNRKMERVSLWDSLKTLGQKQDSTHSRVSVRETLKEIKEEKSKVKPIKQADKTKSKTNQHEPANRKKQRNKTVKEKG